MAINSLPAYGQAGLKCVMSVLQHDCVAVPSLMLSATGNIPGFQKYDYPFEQNLFQTLRHLEANDLQVLLYVGYLAEKTQIKVILNALEEFQAVIQQIVIDPVCGDNGKAYVSNDLIKSWPLLVEKADWATPNLTEVSLLTDVTDQEAGIETLQIRFPNVNWIITSSGFSNEENQMGNLILEQNHAPVLIPNPKIGTYVTGTGDTFTSAFVKYFWIEEKTPRNSVELAVQTTLRYINLLTK